MIDENKPYLLDEKYYIKLLPMLLRDSYGFKEQLSYFVNILQQFDFVCDCYLNCLDLYNTTWGVIKNKDGSYKINKPWVIKDKDGNEVTFTNYESLLDYFIIDEENEIEEEFIVLDFIASLVGINRDVVYQYIVDPLQPPVKETLHLTNKELYHYILIAIARNNYDGTREMLKEVYEKAFLSTDILKSIKYINKGNSNVQIQIIYNPHNITENEITLFKSGDYLIKSLGLNYSIQMTESIDNIFTFGKNDILDNISTII